MSTPRRSIALLLESDGPGGAERMLLHLAEELRRRGHTVCPIGPSNGCGWLAEEFRRRGFDPEVFTLRRAIDWRCVEIISEVFRRRRIDVVHSHEFTMAVYGAAAARRAGIPHFVTMHGGMGFAQRWRRRMAIRWAFRASRGVVAVSDASRATLSERIGVSPDQLHVIRNGIEFEPGDGAAVRLELGVAEIEPLLLAVGNLYPVKGHDVLLRALARVQDHVWRLAIAGRGDEEPALKGHAHALGIAHRVHFLGYRTDVANLLAAADVFVMPSLSEGLPLALIEAMFAGKPIVASAVGGIPELIRSGVDGILVPPGNAQELASELRGLLADRRRRTALAQAARRAVTPFNAAAMAAAYEALYLAHDRKI